MSRTRQSNLRLMQSSPQTTHVPSNSMPGTPLDISLDDADDSDSNYNTSLHPMAGGASRFVKNGTMQADKFGNAYK